MARAYKPAAVFSQAMVLLIPTYERIHGTPTKIYPSIKDAEKDHMVFFGNFKTYGGSDRTVNGIFVIEHTAIIETWFRPDIKSDCAIGLPDTGEIFEIVGVPEDIERRHQYLRIRVQEYKGGA